MTDTYRARHAGPNPVIAERQQRTPSGRLTGEVMRYYADDTIACSELPWARPATIDPTADTIAFWLDNRPDDIAVLNATCDRCGRYADADTTDLPTDAAWCQSCLDDASHAEEEHRQAALIRALADADDKAWVA